MSPSEADLRAALRDGEDDARDTVDADVVIWAAKGIRARRQHRLVSVAAAVVVIAGGATGITALASSWHGSDAGGSAGSAALGGPAGRASAANAGSTGLAHAARDGRSALSGADPAAGQPAMVPSAALRRSQAVTCRPRPRPVPASSAGSAGGSAAAPILAKPALAFGVCVYPTATSEGTNTAATAPKVLAVTGPAAAQLAASLRDASRTPISRPCPLIRTTAAVTLVMTPVTRSGATLRPIVASASIPACNTEISNGVAVRYDWQFPPRLLAVLGIGAAAGHHGSTPVGVEPRLQAPPAASGSPAH